MKRGNLYTGKMNIRLFLLNPGLYIGYFFSQIAWAASPFVSSYLIGKLFDCLKEDYGFNHLYLLIVLLLSVHIVSMYLIRKAGLIDVLIQFSAGRKIRNNIVRMMIDSKRFKTDHVGSFLDVLHYDVMALQYMLLTQLDLISQLIFLIVALFIFGGINFSMTIYIIMPIILLSYISWRWSEKYRREYTKNRDNSIAYSKFVSETVVNREALQFFSSEEMVETKCRAVCEARGKSGLKREMMEIVLGSGTEFFGYIGIGMIMISMIIFNNIQDLTIGQFTLFVGFMGYGCLFLKLLGEASFSIREGEDSLERIGKYLSLDSQVVAQEIANKDSKCSESSNEKTSVLSIVFQDFRLVEYDCPHSFVLNRGDIVAITGPNGSGKTWLIEAILGFAPHHGEVHIQTDKKGDIKIGFVAQATHLFHASMEENISLFTEGASINRAASVSNIEGTLLETREKIGMNGKELSEGQRQRVSIARAMFDNSGFVMMDAPFAFLDKENRKSIFDKISSEIGILVVASDNINILNKANMIIEMNQKCMNVKEMIK